jgi:predicted nucleotidyltransferase component of viral defense system
MINRPAIVDWEKQAPWPENQQIEQDLLLSRAIVEIFSDEKLSKTLLFRGGTALYKLHVKEPIRYSEDLDFVMIDKGPIGPVYDLIRDKLDPLMGEPSRDQKESMAIMTYTFESEFPPQGEQHLKLEINYEEDFSVLETVEKEYEMENPWFEGSAKIPTFNLNELMASKLRALFQRRKGRDLFDLWFTLTRNMIESDTVINCFDKYTESLDTPITRARFEKNLTEKLEDRPFIEDLEPLISRDFDYDVEQAMHLLHEEIIMKLPGDPYQGDNNIFIQPEN